MLIPDTYYHIYNHANGDDNLFKEERNYSFFLNKYYQHINPIADTVAWCLMPNHFHLLIKIKNEEALLQTFPKFKTLVTLRAEEKERTLSNLLSKQFSNFFSSYTQAFNKTYKRRGSLFLKNFKRKEICTDEYLQTLILYIHLNPVKHGFINDINDWGWTSYNEFPEQKILLFDYLFNTKDNYVKQHLYKQEHYTEYQQLEYELT